MERPVFRTGPQDGWLYYWFVQYNPLYFFSALCVLLGMHLVTAELPDWYTGQLIVVVVMHLYEFCLIACAALLFRIAKKRRPGVILGLAAMFFLFDPTLRTEGVTALGPVGLAMAMLWMVLVVVKLAALGYAFRLSFPVRFWITPALSAFVIAAMPYLLEAQVAEPGLLLTIAVWAGAIQLAVFVLYKPAVRCEDDLDDWGETVRRRAVRAAPIVWAGFYLYHLVAWMGIQNLPMSMHMLIPYVALVMLAARQEAPAWICAFILLGGALTTPSELSAWALAVGAGLAWIGWRQNRPRLYLGVVLCAYLSVWTLGISHLVPPEPSLVLNLLGAGAVLLVGWRYQLYTALPAAGLCLIPGATEYLPQNAFQWGVMLLALGFVKLFGGFAVNWYANGKS